MKYFFAILFLITLQGCYKYEETKNVFTSEGTCLVGDNDTLVRVIFIREDDRIHIYEKQQHVHSGNFQEIDFQIINSCEEHDVSAMQD